MSRINDVELTQALYNYTVKVLVESNKYRTKECILQKVLEECADILQIQYSCKHDKNVMHIHSDNMDKIDMIWQTLMNQGTKILHDEQNTYKLLKSSDFVNILDIQKFINILSSKNEEHVLRELLAIDGFQGLNETKNYIENLKFGDKGTNHVQIVREIYRKFNVPVKVLYFALLKIYEAYTTDDEVKELVTNIIDELSSEMQEYDVESIMSMYVNSISDLKSIALTKLATLKNVKKKSKSAKRKLRTNLKEKEHKKFKGSTDDDDEPRDSKLKKEKKAKHSSEEDE